MSSLCFCNGEAIASNQDAICTLLLEDEEFSSILMPIKSRRGVGQQRIHEVVISDNIEGENEPPLILEVDQIHNYYTQKHDKTLYDYFESMSKLVSLMCLDRNYHGIDILDSRYTADFVIDSFLNEKLPLNLRSNLALILITLHIDREPLETL
jgi:hypothetical protein